MLSDLLKDIERLELEYHNLRVIRNMYDFNEPDEKDDYNYHDYLMLDVEKEINYLEQQLRDYYATKGID